MRVARRSVRRPCVILQLRQGKILQYTHFSPLSGLLDQSGNYHAVTINLSEYGDQTLA